MWLALTRSVVQMDWLRRNTAVHPMAERVIRVGSGLFAFGGIAEMNS
jgi:hypothetical protein